MRRFVVYSVMLSMLLGLSAVANDEFVEVSHEELLEYPQKYWSQGILFQDTLTAAPGGRSISIAKKRYLPFQTKNLGTCYVEASVAGRMAGAVLNEEYIFQGTVLHQPASFFGRGPSFYVVAQKATRAVNGVSRAQEDLLGADGDGEIKNYFEALMGQIQQGLVNYARKNQVDIDALFARDFDKRDTVINIIYSGIATVEQDQSTTARKLLGDFIYEIFSAEYQRGGRGMKPVVSEEGGHPSAVVLDAGDSTEESRSETMQKRAFQILLKPGVKLPASRTPAKSAAEK